jgi:hypothetical protein
MRTQRYTVWISGGDVTDCPVLWDEAVKIASDWIVRGYEDVRVVREIPAYLRLMV